MNATEETLTDSLAFLLAQQGRVDYAVRGLDLWLSEKRPSVETDLITVRTEAGRKVVSCIETKVHSNRDGRRNRLIEQIRTRERANIFDEIWVAWDTDDTYTDSLVAGQGTFFIDSVAASAALPTAKIVKVIDAPRRTPTLGRAWESLWRRLRQLENCPILRESPSRPTVFVRCPGCTGSGTYYYAFHAPPNYELREHVHAPFCIHNPSRVRFFQQFIASVEYVRDGEPLASLVRTALVRT